MSRNFGVRPMARCFDVSDAQAEEAEAERRAADMRSRIWRIIMMAGVSWFILALVMAGALFAFGIVSL